jgi:hypothetical protein
MSFKLALTLALALLAPAPSHAQEGQTPPKDEQKVIEDFVNTRGAIFERPGRKKPTPRQRPSQARPGRKGSAASAATKKGAGAPPAAPAKTTPADAASPQTPPPAGESPAVKDEGTPAAQAGPPRPIGLGYTLYMNDDDSNVVVVDASREFKEGDQIRIQLETTIDGFLYIFQTEDGGSPLMLFPNAALEQGRNNVAANSREFYPLDPGDSFEFDARPAAVRLYFVVSRNALPGVPVGEELVKFCGEREECYWNPSASEWERIKAAGAGDQPVEAKNGQLAGLRVPAPAPATRGLKLKKGEPAPAFVRVNQRPETDVLVTTLDLVHK